ncbi:MAG: sulfatase [Acidobacteria bacterium]|nr:sulfatase [Acidobacteriota bacterium]
MKIVGNEITEKIYIGAVQGLMAWTAYAAVECSFLSIITRLRQPGAAIPLEGREAALLFGVYPVVGLLLGGLSGLVLSLAARRVSFLRKATAENLFPAAATFTLIWALVLNLAVLSPLGPSIWVRLLFAVLLSVGLARRAGTGMWAGRLGILLNPWTASLLLLGLPWMNSNLLLHSSGAAKAVSSAAYLIAVSLIAWAFHWAARTASSGKSSKGPRISFRNALARLAVIAIIVLGTASFLEYRAYPKARSSRPATEGVGRPNVVLVVLDTVRADHLSVYGYAGTTPHLKQFAEEATLFTRAIAPSDVTLSSHASLFTGLYASRHGAHLSEPGSGQMLHDPGSFPLADKFHTLAEILSESGYLTMAVIANPGYLGRGFHLDQGFAYYSLPSFSAAGREFYLREGLQELWRAFSGSQLGYWRAEEVNRRVFPLLVRARKDGRPFFLFVNYMDAHEPYGPPPPFDTLFPGKDETMTATRYYELEAEVNARARYITDRERRHILSQYDGGIAYLDFQLAKLMTRLKQLDLYENSLIIITADHGQAFGERSFSGHGGLSVYQDLVHVPLLIRYPNRHQKAVMKDVVSLVDIMPTALDVLGLEIPKDIDGQSLRKQNEGSSKIVISESFPEAGLIASHPRFHRVERALFAGSLKFIYSTAGKRELYDLSQDPNETTNLYSAKRGVSREMEAKLNEWLRGVRAEYPTPSQLDKETLDRLRSLGYLQ